MHQSVLVRSGLEHTFAVFVREIGSWWPLRPFSIGTTSVRTVTFEQSLGGRVYETWDDKSEHDWGTILAWNPPHGFCMTWNVTGTPTEVELSFTAEAEQRTRVDVEHRGWDRLTQAELERDCALPGGYLGGSFTQGWSRILAEFVAAAQA
ncbi:SRPBCC domain-containing protein [Rathayibacter soli]|uniref:SRPBCC domain-containing protein n=1 Tax=Rathayibacter soli TaxID=3144168 RepID=UPI0027E41C91|nr:SRPBCC domain-containing protein [Glaciibacter superstes]